LPAKARINADMLVWARESADYSREDAAKKLRLNPDVLAAWERGEDAPSIPRLRRLSELYKRPLAAFYLAQRPTDFQVVRDFRMRQGAVAQQGDPRLTLEIRRAQQRREVATELMEDIGEEASTFTMQADLTDNPETVGARLREYLGVMLDEQATWRDPRSALNAWRKRAESRGVLVFQFTSVPTDVSSGFSIAEPVLPVIAYNRRDAVNGRTFTLLHEAAHLALRVSGICDHHEPSQQERVEVFCNAVAAAALVPADALLAHRMVAGQARGNLDWTDEQIEELAQHFSCSREAIVRRLLTLGRTYKQFYELKRKQYADARAADELQKRKQPKKKMKRNVPSETVANLGAPLITWAFSSYHQRRLTLNELSDVLGVRTQHLDSIERRIAGR
jgi:Zn-dependent peptidase ImmA (M78 family)/DNA-binding XRE family transcriptional regulator